MPGNEFQHQNQTMIQAFRKMLGGMRNVAGSCAENLVAEPRGSVLDLFRTDLSQLAALVPAAYIASHEHGGLQEYTCLLDYLECGIFDKMSVRCTGQGALHITFSCDTGTAAQLSALVADICNIYGCDSNRRGPLSREALAGMGHLAPGTVFNRDWMDYPRYPYPVALRCHAGRAQLSVWA